MASDGSPSGERERVLSPLAIVALVVLGALALGFLTWAHYAFWRWRFAPTDQPDEIHRVRTADGWSIQLRRYLPRGEPRYREPVVLCHGLGANHYNVDWDPPYGLAQYLAEAGRDCWVISLRGHGGSDRPSRRNGLRWGFSFDDHLRFDVTAALEAVARKTGARRLQWVGHSMGGMLAYALGGTPHEELLAGGVVAVGSPASFSDQPYLRRLARLGVFLARRTRIPQRWVTRMIAPFMGFFDLPFSELAVKPKSMDGRVVRRLQAWAFEDISSGVMRQFHDWIANDVFRSLDGAVNYHDRMRAFRAPVLLIAATADLLAPPACVKRAFELLGSEDKTLRIVGRAHGTREDYGHGDLLLGKAAPEEIYPMIEAWLADHATPVEAPREIRGTA